MGLRIKVSGGAVRVDAFLAGELADVSRTRIQKLIVDGCVSVNGTVVVKKNSVLEAGDEVSVDDTLMRPVDGVPPVAQDIPLDVLYEDEYLAVINKPAGLVVHPGNGNADGTVVNALLYRFGSHVSSGSDIFRPGIIHRLDKDTSGALMVAKTDAAHAKLAELFSARTIGKTYTGFCVGGRPKDREVIELPLARHHHNPTMRAVNKNHGAPAVTEYELKSYRDGISLMQFMLHTGRTHQIRVHCAYMGFPIVNDNMYGGSQEKVLKIAPMERPFAYSVFKCFTRQALHAQSLSFTHPFTQEKLVISAPYPCDFCDALDIMRQS
ncbi:MAG: RluA family pseudouridine synthase [Chitinispirillia bacterium]|nr:RluA family pseudouridine synthase [Chitinispirillia bacterium]MCL2242375.1 RluA family pseudouridine synthase [Chitinispirillia bacterium]